MVLWLMWTVLTGTGIISFFSIQRSRDIGFPEHWVTLLHRESHVRRQLRERMFSSGRQCRMRWIRLLILGCHMENHRASSSHSSLALHIISMTGISLPVHIVLMVHLSLPVQTNGLSSLHSLLHGVWVTSLGSRGSSSSSLHLLMPRYVSVGVW